MANLQIQIKAHEKPDVEMDSNMQMKNEMMVMKMMEMVAVHLETLRMILLVLNQEVVVSFVVQEQQEQQKWMLALQFEVMEQELEQKNVMMEI